MKVNYIEPLPFFYQQGYELYSSDWSGKTIFLDIYSPYVYTVNPLLKRQGAIIGEGHNHDFKISFSQPGRKNLTLITRTTVFGIKGMGYHTYFMH